MPSVVVSVGTDGTKDWVQTPDGQKFGLGSVSVLSFVTKLLPSRRPARRVLDDFLKGGSALFPVDDGAMWSLLAPRRARFASGFEGSFMFRDQQRISMETLARVLTKTESIVAYCNKQASAGNPIDPQAFKDLGISTQRLACLELAEADTDEAAYEANLKAAAAVLEEAKITVGTINRLASDGKRFNRVAALKDVARVTSRVAEICEKTALTEDWVSSDLVKLAAENHRIYNLFHPKKG